MLSRFTVSNYKSFSSSQCLSMEAGKIRSNTERVYIENQFKLLKFLAIYGANASGKSSLVDAFSFAQEVIVNGIPVGCNNDYCRINEANRNLPSTFSFVIKIGERKYEYGFEILLSIGEFTSEHLFEITKTSLQKTIFSRDITAGTYEVTSFFKGNEVNSRLKIYAEDIAKDGSALLLRQMNQNKGSLYTSYPELGIYKKVYRWFKHALSVNNPDRPVTNYPYITNEEHVAQISSLLDAFGTGIAEFKVVTVPNDKVTSSIPKDLFEHIVERLNDQRKHAEKHNLSNMPSIMLRADDNSMFIIQIDGDEISCKTIEFVHKNSSAIFSLSEESDGTIRLLDLIEVLLCDDDERVYVIDEINRRFHPLLTRKFIEEYLKLAKKRNIQLIVTTHESELMSFDLLRKDEIAFVSKNEFGESSYFSMETFDARFDKKVRNAYLHGDYGAIPTFKEITIDHE